MHGVAGPVLRNTRVSEQQLRGMLTTEVLESSAYLLHHKVLPGWPGSDGEGLRLVPRLLRVRRLTEMWQDARQLGASHRVRRG